MMILTLTLRHTKLKAMTNEQLIALTKRRMQKLKMTQSALADEIGISKSHLNHFLKGREAPAMRLLAYLGYGQKTVYYKLKGD